MKKQPGYILVLTLMIISLAVGLVTAIVRQSFNYRRQLCTSIERGRVRMFALSSLEIALAQVSRVVAKNATQKESVKQPAASPQAKQPPAPQQAGGTAGDKKDPMQEWAEKVFPYLNRWQTFDFDGSTDGFEGVMRIYIASENGKLNIASLEKSVEQKQPAAQSPPRTPQNPQQGRGAPPPATQGSATQGSGARQPGQQQSGQQPSSQQNEKKDALTFVDQLFMKDKEVSLRGALKDFKTRFKRPPEDPSELLRIKNFDKYKDLLFMNPEASDRSLVIMDLFTTVTPDAKINPFLASRSLKKLLGFTESNDTKALAKGVKSSMNWASDWDKVLAPVYGKTYASLDPAVKEMLSPAFKVSAFSVFSSCKVGSITQRVYALLEVAESSEELAHKVSSLEFLRSIGCNG